MIGVAPTEMLLLIMVAVLVIGPKELPALLRRFGRWSRKLQEVRERMRSGFDEIMRQAEVEETDRAFHEAEEARRQSEALLAARQVSEQPATILDTGGRADS